MLQRELLPLKERLVKAEAAEKTKREYDQQKEQTRTGVDKSKAFGGNRIEQAPLNLSREEVQLSPANASTRSLRILYSRKSVHAACSNRALAGTRTK